MSQNTFEIAFSGSIAPGADAAQVKRNVAALFKTELAKVEPLFSGKRFVIKKGLDEASALKYQRALREAGAITEIVDAAAQAKQALQESLDQAPAALAAAPAAGALDATIAEPGVILVEPEKVVPPVIDTSGMHLDAPGVVLVESAPVPDLRVDVTGMSMAAPGVVLVEPAPVQDLAVDVSGMSMAAPGVVLVEPAKTETPMIDTSRLSLVHGNSVS